MYAVVGVSELNFPSDDAAKELAGGILAGAKAMDGFVTGHFAWSADHKHGRSMMVFETEEQAEAMLAQAQASIPAGGPVEVLNIGVFEVVAS